MKITEDIELKPIVSEDAKTLFHIIDSEREYLRTWLPFVDFSNKIADLVDFVESALVDENQAVFVIQVKGKTVGLIGLKDIDRGNQKAEIGYWMSQHVQGGGVMTRSVAALLRYSFEELELNRIQIKVAIKNKKSFAIPERLGFSKEGVERDGELLVDNVFTDIAIYSLLRKEYEK